MKLLIVGAGGHGNVVKEIAQAQKDYHFDSFAFVDDKSTNAIGTTADLKDLQNAYDMAIVAIGNNRIRASLQRKLKELGYHIPTLIHPTAYVSPSARIGEGTVVEPMAIINANACIHDGCIISVGSIVDHDAVVEEYCHVNAGAIVMSMTHLDAYEKIDAGKVLANH